MPRRSIRRAGAALLIAWMPALAEAQAPLEGPPEAPPPRTPPSVVKRLDFGISVFGGYDHTALVDANPAVTADPRLTDDSAFSGAAAALVFSRSSPRVSAGMTAATTLRYYTIAPRLVPVDHSVGANVTARVGRRVTVRAGGSGSYSPYYSFGDFLQTSSPTGDVVAAPSERNITRLATYTARASGGFTWSPSSRTSIDGSYLMDTVSTSNAAYRTLSQGANAVASHRTTRYSQLRVGYGLRQWRYGEDASALRVHDINTGFGYARPLSFSRRTTVGFNVGTSVAGLGSAYSFFVTGNGSIAHQLTRRWSTAVDYRRDLSTFAGISTPFISDAVSGSLGGIVSRKVNVGFTGGYSRGRAALDVANGYAAHTVGARLGYQLARYLPVYVEYVYYHYRFERPVGLDPGFPLFADRQGVRFGLSYSIPFIGQRTS